jgi:signal transduction histidine kinase
VKVFSDEDQAQILAALDEYPQFNVYGHGMGLGLAFSRWGAEANDGRIYTRKPPGRGCVFIVDLPRQPVRAVVFAQS